MCTRPDVTRFSQQGQYSRRSSVRDPFFSPLDTMGSSKPVARTTLTLPGPRGTLYPIGASRLASQIRAARGTPARQWNTASRPLSTTSRTPSIMVMEVGSCAR